ncbi:MAG: 16S rRNA processing protein RimM [Deltaproteobacteria bacterium]|nr:16S rRNA processing protein RimM [Deltaproteobacteria bacterium]
MAKNSIHELELGVVVRAQGLHGAVGVKLFHPESSLEEPPLNAFRLTKGEASFIVSRLISRRGERLVLAVEGVTDRDAAEALRGAKLLLAREALPLAQDEYLYVDLIGCTASEGTHELGKVVQVFSAGASDVLVIRDATHEWLIPLVEAWVGEVDIQARRIMLLDADQWEGRPISPKSHGSNGA